MDHPNFELPKQIERYLAALSRLYDRDGKRELQKIIVNAQIRVNEGTSYDNWNNGIHGHTLIMVIPETLYLSVVNDLNQIQTQLQLDLNQIQNIQDEHIDDVFLEMEVFEDSDWRQNSGLLISSKRSISTNAVSRIWGEENFFRIFLSHKSEVKVETAKLKADLRVLGVTAFVAHEDIHPTQTWQDEIESALHSMDAFVAVMTSDFHDSEWTDQEVGFALGRGVPVISLKLGRNPYGFLGKFQALSCDWNKVPERIVQLLIKHDRMLNAYIEAMRYCTSWDNGNKLSRMLSSIEMLTRQQLDDLVNAYNETRELSGSFGFNGTRPTIYGDGILSHVHRLGGKNFILGENNKLINSNELSAQPLDEEIPF